MLRELGVDADQRTDLVTGGVSARVRNRSLGAMPIGAAGLVMLVPIMVSFAAFIVLAATLGTQVRAVEEPYPARTRGTRGTRGARSGRDVATRGRHLPRGTVIPS